MFVTHTLSASGPGHLAIDRQENERSVTLSLHGELDLNSAPLLEQELQDAESTAPRRIVLDLAALDFLDSTGLRLLIGAHHRAQTNGHALAITHVPRHARRLFRLTGIDAVLPLE